MRVLWLRQVNRRDDGYTLGGLAFVLAVFGILAGIAVPSFLGNRNNAFDKDAQASINVVLQAAKIHYQNYGDFSDGMSTQCGDTALLAADLQRLEPSIDVVVGTSRSSSSRVVSVQAVNTWNSGNESLGCQGFYAVALSSTGSCWAARLTVEGRYLATGSVSPIVLATEINTGNSAITPVSNLAINGLAYGALKPQTSGADGTATNGIAAIAAACTAVTHSTGVATLAGNYIAPSQFYSTWRDVAAVTTTTTTTTTVAVTCAQGGSCNAGVDTGPGGGIVFYAATGTFASPGSACNTAGVGGISTCRYLEAAQTTGSSAWNDVIRSWTTSSNQNSAVSGADGTAIGTGYQNTLDIIAQSGNVAATSAAVAAQAHRGPNSLSDWFLPSKLELNQLCRYAWNLTFDGTATTCSGMTGTIRTGFSTGSYWSSSERSAGNGGLFQVFSSGAQSDDAKRHTYYVRPVRAFG